MGKQKQKKVISSLSTSGVYFFTALSIGIFIFFSTRGITFPYVGYNAWNYNIYSLIAHNYNTFGFWETKFAPVISVSKQLPSIPDYYLHHPPLISIVLALVFNVLGEEFWVGRLTVIIFSLLSLFALFGVSYELRGKIFACVSIVIYSLLPASILFGRMIGQEALVLFFALATLYSILRYIKTSNNIFFIFSILTTMLGVLSDWPMIYFILSLTPWLYHKKQKKLLFSLLSVAIGIGMSYILYIYWILGSLTDLVNAISIRSLGQLTHMSYWPVRWIITIAIRLLFYFNPIVICTVLLVLILYVKKTINLKNEDSLLICSLGLWGILHVLLFPEGSFGHPYWIYYLLPCIVLICAYIIFFLYEKKSFIFLILVFISMNLYVWKIESWKTKEIKGNIWRFEIAKSVSHSLTPYSSFSLHPLTPVDYDLFAYAFAYDVDIQTVSTISEYKKKSQYLYICQNTCGISDDLNYLINSYQYKRVTARNAEYYIFSLDKKRMDATYNSIVKPPQNDENNNAIGTIKQLYLYILNTTGMPQL